MNKLNWVLLLILTIITQSTATSYMLQLLNVPSTWVFMLGVVLILTSIYVFMRLYVKILSKILKLNK